MILILLILLSLKWPYGFDTILRKLMIVERHVGYYMIERIVRYEKRNRLIDPVAFERSFNITWIVPE